MEPRKETPRTLFANRVQYLVPHFQRHYVWREDVQWRPLWDDLHAVASEFLVNYTDSSTPEDARARTRPHFFGTAVLKQLPTPVSSPDRRILVDGQQRFTTLQLVMASMRHLLCHDRDASGQPHDNGAVATSVLKRYLYNDDPQTPEERYKIRSSTADFAIFRQLVDDGRTSDDSHVLAKYFRFFRARLDGYLLRANEETRLQRTTAILDSVSHLFSLFTLNLDARENEYVIFETLNARGEPLSEWDKAKNHLLAKHTSTLITPKWGDSERFYSKHLAEYDTNPWWRQDAHQARFSGNRINLCLNHWLKIIRNRNIPHQLAYYHFTRHMWERRAEGEIDDVTASFARFAEHYRVIESFEMDGSIQGNFRQRRDVLRAGVVVPVMMKLLDRLGLTPAFDLATRCIESFLVRRLVMGHYARGYEDLFLSLVQKLNASTDGDFVAVVLDTLEQFHGGWPDDEPLSHSVAMSPIQMHQRRARMVLEAIEEALRSEYAGAKFVAAEPSVEHVMPQQWEANWPLRDTTPEGPARRNQSVHTFGNLTLTNSRLNALLSNAAWTEKREQLRRHDNLFLNKQLLDSVEDTEWNEESIRRRGWKLAEAICRIWPNSGTLRREFAEI